MKCACMSSDAHNCWALRYHGHTGISELTVHSEGGPCECSCHETDLDEDEEHELAKRALPPSHCEAGDK